MVDEMARRTEKSSVNPQIRNSHAHVTTDTANAALPSIVFGVLLDHRWRPRRFPTMDASVHVLGFEQNDKIEGRQRTKASPTPSARMPV